MGSPDRHGHRHQGAGRCDMGQARHRLACPRPRLYSPWTKQDNGRSAAVLRHDMSYKITLQPSGHRFTAEADESVLDAALRQGLIIPYSCRGGTCGRCMGKVVEGEVRYPDGQPPALSTTEAAIGQALFCQARPASDLVVEVREVRRSEDIQPRRLPCRVAQIDELAHDVRRLWLQLPGNERLQFFAGQYIDILLKD